VNRGDVVTVEWPGFGIRPAVVVTRDGIIPFLTSVTVVMVTSTIRGVSTEVPLDRNNGVSGSCVANCLHIITIGKDNIGSVIGTLDPEQLFGLGVALKISLGLDHLAV